MRFRLVDLLQIRTALPKLAVAVDVMLDGDSVPHLERKLSLACMMQVIARETACLPRSERASEHVSEAGTGGGDRCHAIHEFHFIALGRGRF